jgi:hypothetical protein
MARDPREAAAQHAADPTHGLYRSVRFDARGVRMRMLRRRASVDQPMWRSRLPRSRGAELQAMHAMRIASTGAFGYCLLKEAVLERPCYGFEWR